MGFFRRLGTAATAALLAISCSSKDISENRHRQELFGLELRIQQLESRAEAAETENKRTDFEQQQQIGELRSAYDSLVGEIRVGQQEALLALRDSISPDQYALVQGFVLGNIRNTITEQTRAMDILLAYDQISAQRPSLGTQFAEETTRAVIAGREYELLTRLYEYATGPVEILIEQQIDRIVSDARNRRITREEAARFYEAAYSTEEETRLGQYIEQSGKKPILENLAGLARR